MIKVTHVITGLGSGGAETMLFKLLSATNKSRFEPDVISLTTEGAIGERIVELGVDVRTLGMRLQPRDGARFAMLVRWLREERPDVVQTWMYHANLVGGLAAYSAGRIPVVWNIRAAGDNFEGYRRDTIMTVKIAAPLSRVLPERIVLNSEAAKKAHSKMGYSIERSVVIPNGFDTLAFRPCQESRHEVRTELGIDDNSHLIGLVARFHTQKGHSDFVKAASTTLQSDPDAHFLLCGQGVTPHNASLANWIAATGRAANFHVLGERTDIARITSALDIATCSSSSEAFSNTIGEAMACGVPCVVTDVGDSPRIVGDTGIVVPPRRPDLLADAWMKLLELAPSDRMALGAAARQRIIDLFSLAAITQRYQDLYAEVVDDL